MEELVVALFIGVSDSSPEPVFRSIRIRRSIAGSVNPVGALRSSDLKACSALTRFRP
jgi:hypothetical protein